LSASNKRRFNTEDTEKRHRERREEVEREESG
jgi:hypothetical protein